MSCFLLSVLFRLLDSETKVILKKKSTLDDLPPPLPSSLVSQSLRISMNILLLKNSLQTFVEEFSNLVYRLLSQWCLNPKLVGIGSMNPLYPFHSIQVHFIRIQFIKIKFSALLLEWLRYCVVIIVLLVSHANTFLQASVNIIVGSHVWVEDPKLAWSDGEVIKIHGQDVHVKTSNGKEVSIWFCNSYIYSRVILCISLKGKWINVVIFSTLLNGFGQTSLVQ